MSVAGMPGGASPGDEPQVGGGAAPRLEFVVSRHFNEWLASLGASLAFSTYETGKLFLVGTGEAGRLSVFERSFPRCMGLHAEGRSLYLGSLYQIWRLENCLDPGAEHAGYDALYVPRIAWTTGDVDAHDLAIDGAGRVVFANTLFSCVASVSERFSFEPLWKPPFVSRLAAEDRCHLNGLAMRDGRPAFVTCVAAADVADGWRERRADGGLVMAVPDGETILGGLAMPHSPRWHDGSLWLLDSGSGYLGYVEPAAGRFERVAFCPGYLRGLAFAGGYAIVGLSRPRAGRTFSGMSIERELGARGAEMRCGLHIIDLRTGDAVHWLRIEGVVDEIYDVAVLPGIRRPMAVGLRGEEIRRVITLPPS